MLSWECTEFAFFFRKQVQNLNAQGVTLKRQLKNSDTARITNYLQTVFNAERRGKKSLVRNIKSKMVSRQKLIMYLTIYDNYCLMMNFLRIIF